MTGLPVDTITPQEVFEWYECTEQLTKLRQREALLRARVFRHLVPTPVEGMNTVELAKLPMFAGIPTEGYVLKAQHVIRRDVDEGLLVVLQPQFTEKKILVDKLIKRKPELVVSEYRKLTDEERQLFDQALIVKNGSPQLDIVRPKKRGE